MRVCATVHRPSVRRKVRFRAPALQVKYLYWHVRVLCQFLQPQPDEHSGVPYLRRYRVPRR